MDYILANTEEDIALEWTKYEGYTVRPLPSTVSYYEKLIRANNNKNHFLLYGGTPEIRSIFQQQQLELTLIDQSEKIVRAMGRLTDKGLPIAENENFKQLNWLNIQEFNQSFDCLIGDDAINMLPAKDFDAYLKIASDLLSENGIFICHLLVKPDDELIDKSFLDIVDEYKSGIISSCYDLASRLNFICFDKTNYQMGWQQTINQLGNLRLNYFIPHFDFKKTFGLCNSQFACLPQQIFEKLAKKYFCIEEIFYPHEYQYCLFEPVYVLSKK